MSKGAVACNNKTVSTQRIDIPSDLFAQLRAKAELEGRTVDELAADTLREGLKEKRWQDMFSINQRHGRVLSDAEIVDAVHEDRRAGR